MSIETLDVAKRWFEEVWNQRNLAVVDDLLTEDSVCRGEMGEMKGKDAFRDRLYEPLVTAFPDLRVEVEATLLQDRETVVRWVARGTHTGTGVGVAPTGRSVEFRGITWLRIVQGKLVEGWQYSNIAAQLESLTS